MFVACSNPQSFPILGFVQPKDGDILTALVYADAPSSWFHYAIVRALYGLHWSKRGCWG